MSEKPLSLSQPQIDPDSSGLSLVPEEPAGRDHLPWHLVLGRERERRGWSQADLAERMEGVSVKTINRWERGKSHPQPYYRQLLGKLFGQSLEELGLIPSSRAYTIALDLLVPCGDCGQPEITVKLCTIAIDQSGSRTTFYCRLTNGTAEDAGLRLESASLTDPHGNFCLGQSVGSFLLSAGQSIPLSIIFDWFLQQTIYTLNIVLIRPNRWRNTYQPISLAFKKTSGMNMVSLL